MFKLKNVVPWGRCLDEYRQMFDLSDEDLQRKIIDCGGGPASFNAEMTELGYKVTSCDPLYQFSAEDIRARIEETSSKIVAGLTENSDRFVWQEIKDPQELKQVRLQAMARFLSDYELGLQQKRYLNIELPTLPFADGEFDLAISSHLLFTYSEAFSTDFHLAAIKEMSRVANEARIFPLVENFTGELSPHVEPVTIGLRRDGYNVAIRTVPYEFQRQGNQMLVVSRLEI